MIIFIRFTSLCLAATAAALDLENLTMEGNGFRMQIHPVKT